MLKGIYAPTDFKLKDSAPSIPSSEKLEIISQYPTLVYHEIRSNREQKADYSISLPFVTGARFYPYTTGSESRLYSDYINIGDEALCSHGLGSRLLRVGIRYGLDINSELKKFTTNAARLGLVNTAIAVLGEENVSVKRYGKRYGWESDRPLDELFKDFPPQQGRKYLVDNIIAKIDPDKAMEWERPIPVLKLAKLLDIKEVLKQQAA